MIPRFIVFIIILGSLSSCHHSPRKHYFILSSSPGVHSESGENIKQVIGIGPVEIAEFIDRLPIVYRRADNTLLVSENDYWAEPLDKGIARVLAANLVGRNSSRSFAHFPWRSDNRPQYSLRLQVHSLECGDLTASIDATWELIDNKSKASLQRRHFIRSLPAQPNPQTLARTYSQLLAELALEMDQALNTLPPIE